MSGLERRYRRLLALYPRAHRAAHGEEMLGVLLDGAENRSTPGVAETFDLVWGAVQVHWRHALRGHSRRDTVAIVSLLAPVLLLTGAASTVRETRSVARLDGWPLRMWLGALADVPAWSAWLAAVVLGGWGMRRASVILAWVATAALLTVTILDPARHWSVDVTPGLGAAQRFRGPRDDCVTGAAPWLGFTRPIATVHPRRHGRCAACAHDNRSRNASTTRPIGATGGARGRCLHRLPPPHSKRASCRFGPSCTACRGASRGAGARIPGRLRGSAARPLRHAGSRHPRIRRPASSFRPEFPRGCSGFRDSALPAPAVVID